MSGNTSQSFRDKWEKNQKSFFTETLREGSEISRWILERNGFKSLSDFSSYLVGCKRILDGGCGNGRITALLRLVAPKEAEIVGIDLVGADIASQNLKNEKNVRFETRDIFGDLSDLGKFDFIYCQEVLHHTLDPAGALFNLSQLLNPRGEIAIYVYKKSSC